MKKLLLGTILLALISVLPIKTMAAVDIHIGFPLPPPPPILFPAPPEVIVIPDTYVYAVPDIDVDIFFWGGWWWRPWEGRWYRSRYYDRDWVYYRYIPYFYYDIDPGWRRYYGDHNWHGHRWDYQRIPYQHLQQNWRSWHSNQYWERERKWNVERYQPPPPQQKQELRRQRQVEYGRRPDVQKHEQWRREQQRQPQRQQPQQQRQQQPQVQQPQRQQPQQQHSQPQGQQHKGGSQPPHSQGKPQGGDAGHRK